MGSQQHAEKGIEYTLRSTGALNHIKKPNPKKTKLKKIRLMIPPVRKSFSGRKTLLASSGSISPVVSDILFSTTARSLFYLGSAS
ncbi:hypothetical protein Enr17x_38790 [Gimesia fumaroli]|uniref:Uncharacterized protein n=2 Tax=Gimesia fumaroli TaxID=2527976 RepID=A0A518IFH9_9PLAN|nr:hypothetical protein Enr17x_38790 [Gimesia fumaroli]